MRSWIKFQVLILIVVDNGLVQYPAIKLSNGSWVLILIVVDNGLVHDLKACASYLEGLNPYCSGQWSRT